MTRITKCGRKLLQSGTGLQSVTENYYKEWKVLQSVAGVKRWDKDLLKSVAGITKCDKKLLQSVIIIKKWDATQVLCCRLCYTPPPEECFSVQGWPLGAAHRWEHARVKLVLKI